MATANAKIATDLPHLISPSGRYFGLGLNEMAPASSRMRTSKEGECRR